MTLKEIKKQFLSQYIMASDKTKFKYENELELFFNLCEINSYEDLQNFNNEKMTNFYNYSKEKNWSPNTINQRLGTAKLFSKWCHKKGYTSCDFLEEIKKIRTVNEMQFVPSEEEVNKLLIFIKEHTSKKRLYLMTKLLLNSGLRRMEICNLKLQDLDKENSTIRVLGKGKKIVEQPIPAPIMIEIVEYINTERKENIDKYIKLGGKDKGYLFVSGIGDNVNKDKKDLTNGNKVNETSFYNQIKTYAKNASLENYEKFDVHCLRRHIGTQIYKQSGDIITAKEFLRHSNVATTEKCYINYDKQKVADSINEVFNKNNKTEEKVSQETNNGLTNDEEYQLFLLLQKKFGGQNVN